MTTTKAYVATLPECDIHKYNLGVSGVPAKYDAATTRGSQWASMCEPCWVANRRYPDLGTGKGQEYVLGEPPARDPLAEFAAALTIGDIDAAMEIVGDGDPADFF